MELKHIKGIGPAKQDKLKAAGIDSIESMARADVAAVAKATGMKAEVVKEFKQKAVAMTLISDLKNAGPQTVKALAESGIASLKDLYEASSEFVAKEAKLAKDKAVALQAEAKKLADHIATEAKTSEGRKKLAGEAKDVTIKAAKKTTETAKEILARAQKDGEAAIAMAQAFREKAPAAIKDARVKAEAALKNAQTKVSELKDSAPEAAKDLMAKAESAAKDAEKKVLDLKHKVETFAKTEGEKLKAANEGFFGRLKARFSKN